MVGAPHPTWGEVPIAYVTLRSQDATDEAELIDFVRTRIARFKAPRRIIFGVLPKTSTGKIQKAMLRERAIDLTFG
nr:hypothetical protein [Frankia sp. Cas4]